MGDFDAINIFSKGINMATSDELKAQRDAALKEADSYRAASQTADTNLQTAQANLDAYYNRPGKTSLNQLVLNT